MAYNHYIICSGVELSPGLVGDRDVTYSNAAFEREGGDAMGELRRND